MKRISLTAVAVLVSMGVSINWTGVAADGCQTSACRSGDTYDTRQHRCESGPNFWGYRSHYQPSCPAGYDLDRTNGVCVKQGTCCEKPACKKGYKWDKRDDRCESGPTVLGYRSHYKPKCQAGWDLDIETGLCKKRGCGLKAPPERGELFRNKPDLVVQSFGLLSWGSCLPGQTVFTFQVTVANVGTAASAKAELMVRDHDDHNVPSEVPGLVFAWAVFAPVGPLAPGASQTVTVEIPYFEGRPGESGPPKHMTIGAPHPFKAVVHLGKGDESNEENNESAVINVGAPRGCR